MGKGLEKHIYHVRRRRRRPTGRAGPGLGLGLGQNNVYFLLLENIKLIN